MEEGLKENLDQVHINDEVECRTYHEKVSWSINAFIQQKAELWKQTYPDQTREIYRGLRDVLLQQEELLRLMTEGPSTQPVRFETKVIRFRES